MKKLLAAAWMLAGLCILTACSGTTEDDLRTYLPEDVAAVTQAGAFSEELEELDSATAFMVYRFGDYGLEQTALKDCAVVRSSGATCEEMAVLIWEEPEQAETACQALKDYVESQIEANENYRPNEIPKLENAVVDDMGDAVVLVIADNVDAAIQVLPSEK